MLQCLKHGNHATSRNLDAIIASTSTASAPTTMDILHLQNPETGLTVIRKASLSLVRRLAASEQDRLVLQRMCSEINESVHHTEVELRRWKEVCGQYEARLEVTVSEGERDKAVVRAEMDEAKREVLDLRSLLQSQENMIDELRRYYRMFTLPYTQLCSIDTNHCRYFTK